MTSGVTFGGIYKLGKLIGKGSFGEVFVGIIIIYFIGTNSKTGEEVAVKLVRVTV